MKKNHIINIIKEEAYDFLGLDISGNETDYDSTEFKLQLFNDVIESFADSNIFDNIDIVMSKDEISTTDGELKLEYDGTFTYKTNKEEIPINIHIEDVSKPEEDMTNIDFGDFKTKIFIGKDSKEINIEDFKRDYPELYKKFIQRIVAHMLKYPDQQLF